MNATLTHVRRAVVLIGGALLLASLFAVSGSAGVAHARSVPPAGATAAPNRSTWRRRLWRPPAGPCAARPVSRRGAPPFRLHERDPPVALTPALPVPPDVPPEPADAPPSPLPECWRFARYLVSTGRLSEWPDVGQAVGVQRLRDEAARAALLRDPRVGPPEAPLREPPPTLEGASTP